MTKRQQNQIDRQIDAIVRQRCSGLQINVMDISKVFKAGYAAIAAGQDLETAIVDTYRQLAHG